MNQNVEDVEALRLGVEAGGGGVGRGGVGRKLKEGEAAVVLDELLEEVVEIFACLEKLLDKLKGKGKAEFGEGLVERKEELLGDEAEGLSDGGGGDGAFGKAKDLIEERFGVAKASFGKRGDEVERFGFSAAVEILDDLLEFGDDEGRGNAGEVEALAAADDRGEHFVRLCCGKKEFSSLGRFFKGFQEGIESLLGEHVHFVDDVDFIFSMTGGVADRFIDLPDVVDPSVGGAVNLDDVERLAGEDF